MKNKKEYPYIAIFECLPESIVAKELSPEESKKLLEEWRENIKNGFFSIEKASKVSDNFYIEQYLTKETYDFIKAVSIIEPTSNFGEKVYIINNLQFNIVENEKG